MMKSNKPRLRIEDVLRIEYLLSHYENQRARGLARQEDEENHRLMGLVLEKEPEVKHSRKLLLTRWSKAKWQKTFKNTALANSIENALVIPWYLTLLAFLVGIGFNSTWGLLNDSIHAPFVFVTHAFLPIAFLTLFLTFGGYFGGNQSIILLLKNLVRKARKTSRVLEDKLSQVVDDKIEHGGFFSPMFRAYVWAFSKFEKMLRRLRMERYSQADSIRDGDQPEVDLGVILRRSASVIKAWLYMHIQCALVAYFFGFFLVFAGSLVLKSAAFHWETSFQSILSPERMHGWVRFLGSPWNWLVSSPGLEEIAATQRYYGEAPEVTVEGWAAWAAFLIMAILFYAILPRLVLCIVQKLHLSRELSKCNFAELRFTELLNRMESPAGIQHDGPTMAELSGREAFGGAEKTVQSSRRKTSSHCLFISDELLWNGRHELAEAQGVAMRQMRLPADTPSVSLLLDASPLSGDRFKEKVRDLIGSWLPCDGMDRVVFLIDSGQSPKSNMMMRVKNVREVIGDTAGILILLVHEGEYRGHNDSESCNLWNKMTRKWQDPNILIMDLEIN